jgi:hypothetical protein
MLEDDLDLKILSDKKQEDRTGHGEPEPAVGTEQPLDVEYEGPERRSGYDRRVTWDRRYRVRFEPIKEKPSRRCGKDRRKANQKPEGHWDL